MPRLFSIKPTWNMKGRKFKGLRGFAGKPFHPPLTDIPVGAYILVGAFDLISYFVHRSTPTSDVPADFFISGTHAIVAGAVVSIPTILTGFWDWLKSTPRGSQAWRTANFHMAVMLTVSVLVAIDILLRLGYWETGSQQGADLTITLLSVVVGGLVAFGAAYGGTMVYEFAFNVEQDFDHAYVESEVDSEYGEEVSQTQKG